MSDTKAAEPIAKLSNEFATIWLTLDDAPSNGPRLRVDSLRDHGTVVLDPVALSLLCSLDENVLGLLADIARDDAARGQFAEWFASRHEQLQVPDGLSPDDA